MRDDRPQRPNAYRLRHDRFIETETVQAGVRVYQTAESREAPIIDQLHDRRYLTDEQHGLLERYAHLMEISGLGRSPGGCGAYGLVRGGELSDTAANARSEVQAMQEWLRLKATGHHRKLVDAVASNDPAYAVPPKGPPDWLGVLRFALIALDGYTPEAARALRLRAAWN